MKESQVITEYSGTAIRRAVKRIQRKYVFSNMLAEAYGKDEKETRRSWIYQRMEGKKFTSREEFAPMFKLFPDFEIVLNEEQAMENERSGGSFGENRFMKTLDEMERNIAFLRDQISKNNFSFA